MEEQKIGILRYKNEIDEIIKTLFCEDWMDDSEVTEMIASVVSLAGGYDKLEADINIGIKNGYTIDYQKVILQKFLSKFKK